MLRYNLVQSGISEYAAYFSYHNSNFPLLKYASNVPCFMQVCAALYGLMEWFGRGDFWSALSQSGWKECCPEFNLKTSKYNFYSLVLSAWWWWWWSNCGWLFLASDTNFLIPKSSHELLCRHSPDANHASMQKANNHFNTFYVFLYYFLTCFPFWILFKTATLSVYCWWLIMLLW